MCDTILAMPSATADHCMLFGKNSDRQRNEAQAIEYFSAADHAEGDQVECTYISIPQVRRTYATLVCRPFWMWGAEMGANEHGVVIGNEGLHARSPAPQEAALTGMDLLRLALERSASAAEAVEVITTLLERHGQGGNCGHLTPAYYNNGYMIADAREAYVLETIRSDWMLERVRELRSMSNRYSIEGLVERVSSGMMPLIRDSGWSEQAEPNFAQIVADPNLEHIGYATARRTRSTALLTDRRGRLNAQHMMSVLRDHGSADHPRPDWRMECASQCTICMHAGAEDRPGQTVGSMVSELRPAHAVHWITGTSAPCTSIFKPVLLDALPLTPEAAPTERYDAATLWWRHERIHRAALLGDFAGFLNDIREERDALETVFKERIDAVLDGGNPADRRRVVAQCWREADQVEAHWSEKSSGRVHCAGTSWDTPFKQGWETMNHLAGISVSR